MSSRAPRIFTALAGLFGAAGVGMSAAAAHIGGPNAATAAQFLLFHAPALLGVSLALRAGLVRPGLGVAACVLLSAGVIAFSGALALSAFAGLRPVPMLAPTGGLLMIAGWLLLAVAALALGRD